MSIAAVEHKFTGDTVPYASYDSTKTVLGKLIYQKSGLNDYDDYAGPMTIGLARPGEAPVSIVSGFPAAIRIDDDHDYVYLVDQTAAAATRRVILYIYDKTTSSFDWLGFVTVTFPTGTNHTVRGFRAVQYTYSTGTVAVSGTAVTGTGTAWQTARYAVGARIGFGSTDPSQITTWYEVSAIGSDTGITLSSTAGTISAGTAYVIEEHRLVFANTNATATNGGLFLVKGVSPTAFTVGGLAIPAATTTDNIRASYWLADASTVTATTACGIGLPSPASNTSHDLYFLNGSTTSCQIFKHNIRAALTLTAGKDTTNFLFKTGTGTLSGNISNSNNGRVAVLNHAPVSGVESFYFVSATRVYRCALTDIADASTAFLTDYMAENPPGGTNTFLLTAALTAVEHAGSIDRLIVNTNSARTYLTKYATNNDQMDHILLSDNRQTDNSSSDPNAPPFPSFSTFQLSCWTEGGVGYFVRLGSNSATNQIYAVPISSDWAYAGVVGNISRLISPSISTPNANKLLKLYVRSAEKIGSDNLGVTPEPFRCYIRTSGIADNTGSWILVGETGDLSAMAAGSNIQIMIEFRSLGLTGVPARVYSFAVLYEKNDNAAYYQPSTAKSDLANKRFAWRHSVAYGGSVPPLRVRLYNAETNTLLVDDDTATPTGTWERSTDGTSWSAWTNTDKGNETTYVRYTPASLASGIKVRALLSLA